jgi:hypothetical protein
MSGSSRQILASSPACPNTIEDAQKLVESGFEYVTEIDGVKLFRKRK